MDKPYGTVQLYTIMGGKKMKFTGYTEYRIKNLKRFAALSLDVLTGT